MIITKYILGEIELEPNTKKQDVKPEPSSTASITSAHWLHERIADKWDYLRCSNCKTLVPSNPVSLSLPTCPHCDATIIRKEE